MSRKCAIAVVGALALALVTSSSGRAQSASCDMAAIERTWATGAWPSFVGCPYHDVERLLEEKHISVRAVPDEVSPFPKDTVTRQGSGYDVRVLLYYSLGATAVATQSPTYTVSVSSPRVQEGNQLVFNVVRTPISDTAASVGYTLTDEPEAPMLKAGVGVASFLPGVGTAEIRFPPSPTYSIYQNHRVMVQLQGANVSLGSENAVAVGTIVDDPNLPPKPSYSVSLDPESVSEGAQLRFSVRRGGPTDQPGTVRYRLLEEPVDAQSEMPLRELTFAPGEIEQIVLFPEMVGSTIDRDLNVTLQLVDDRGTAIKAHGSARGTIIDDVAIPPSSSNFLKRVSLWGWLAALVVGVSGVALGWRIFHPRPKIKCAIEPGEAYLIVVDDPLIQTPELHVLITLEPGIASGPLILPILHQEHRNDSHHQAGSRRPYYP